MATKEKEDLILRWLAIAGLVLLGVTIAIPGSFYEAAAHPGADVSLRVLFDVFTSIVFLAVMPFFLKMFFECGFSKDIHKRWYWLILFFFIPIIPAYVYFFVTRSNWYRSRLQVAR